MPTPHDTKLPLRLAYSHREKAEVAIRQCDRSVQEGGVDREHHAKLRASYERELQLAQRTIQRLLGVERARIETLEAQRRSALEEQLHLSERVTARRLTPQAANDANRRLSQRIADLDLQIDVSRSRVESRTSEELGGFIDLSFSEYVSAETRSMETAARAGSPGPVRIRDWYYTCALAVAAAVAVFLPWYSKAGVTSSLTTAEGGLARIVGLAGLPAGVAQFAWIFFAVLPFFGVLLTAGQRIRLSGWGFLVLGFLMLASAAFPGLALGSGSAGVTNLVQLLASFRLGAMVYGASSLGFIVLGAFRVSPPGDSLRHATSVSLALLGSLGAIGLLAALALLGVKSIPQVTFSAALDDASNDRIVFSVTNEGRDSIACYFPLPANADDARSRVGASHTFGLRLDVREKGRDAYSATPPSPSIWDLAQGPLPEDGNVVVNGGSALKGNLDLSQISALGVEPSAVRVQLLCLDGSLVGETEVELDGRYLSKPGPIRNPLIIVPPPPRVSAVPSAPQATTASEGEKPPTGETLIVEFAGVIGGRAIVHVFTPDGSAYDEKTAGPGEPISGEWIVDSLVRQPSSVIMKHVKSGTTAQVIRGNAVEIKPAAGN